MPNNRVLYAIQLLTVGDTAVHGVQSVTMNTAFNLDNVFEFGQIELYESAEGTPAIEMTVERVLDDHTLLYELFSGAATGSGLLARSNETNTLGLYLYSDSEEDSSGTPITHVTMSGMYIGSINYTLPVQGQCRESITFIGDSKVWASGGSVVGFDGTDAPGADGVQRREDVIVASCVFPSLFDNAADHFQDVTISVNFNRQELFELGRKDAYFRYADFPVAVDTTINLTAGGNDPSDRVNADPNVDNLTDETIYFILTDGTIFDLGTNNKLLSVNWSGGGTDGDVVGIAYNYQNFNTLEIESPA